MSDIVFILGAGASKQAGVPVMCEFLDTAFYLLKSKQIRPEYENDFEVVFGAQTLLQRVHSKAKLDINNLESVFAALEMARTIGGFDSYDLKKIDDTIQSLKRLIVQTIIHKLRIPAFRGVVEAPACYGNLVELISRLRNRPERQHQISILTFNYDLATEISIQFKNDVVDYALDEFNRSGGDAIKVLKLHGSLSWAQCNKCKKIGFLDIGQAVEIIQKEARSNAQYNHHQKNIIFDPKFLLNRIACCSQTLSGEPFIVPPTWSKVEHYKSIEPVWRRAATELSEAENIFVVGYSLPETDGFFRHLYALATIKSRPLERFWVFDIDSSGNVEKRFSDLLGTGSLGRFKYHRMGFGEAINEIRKEFRIP